ncbi:unnamed protein product, partial [Owenia fusiformis]
MMTKWMCSNTKVRIILSCFICIAIIGILSRTMMVQYVLVLTNHSYHMYDRTMNKLVHDWTNDEETRTYKTEEHVYDKHHHKGCKRDKNSPSYLSGIFTEPSVQLDFDKRIFSYNVSVDFETFSVRIWSVAEQCDSEGWIRGKKGKIRGNYVLGLQTTVIEIVVFDVSKDPPVNTTRYILNISREPRSLLHHEDFQTEDLNKLKVCMLRQDCDRLIYPNEPCGLQRMGYNSWQSTKNHVKNFADCLSGNEPGAWLVPCIDCNDDKKCYWNEAIWQPNNCSYHSPTLKQIQHSFQGKKVLFLGDSTLRGMMYFLIEAV